LENFPNDQQGNVVIPIGPTSILLRGSTLKNSEWIIGLVLFTGSDSKLMRNSKAAPIKRSRMEKMVNKQILAIFGLLFLMAFISLIGFVVFNNSTKGENAWYLAMGLVSMDWKSILKQFVIFVVMFNTVVPISLYVSMEFVKLLQAYFINNDLDMYYEKEDMPALARTSNLNEELGQIDFIFSDKTGTLTQNQMQFKSCSIGGIKYEKQMENFETEPSSESSDLEEQGGSLMTSKKSSSKSKPSMSIHSSNRQNEIVDPNYDFDPTNLFENLKKNDAGSEIIKEFLISLSICHTAVPEASSENPDIKQYRASSPDEIALVSAARYLGYEFISRRPDKITIAVSLPSPTSSDSVSLLQQEVTQVDYEILDILEFNSTRKRMSVVVRTPEGKIIVYCKGADSVIIERLKQSDPILSSTEEHLNKFATQGLRTLCIGKRELGEAEYLEWSKKYHEAQASLDNRAEKVDLEAEKIEKELSLIGATAIEDKLQDGVPETIANFISAGIKVWMLTGDKLETAINIGHSCKLIKEDMEVLICDSLNEEAMHAWINEKIILIQNESPKGFALVIEGHILPAALSEYCRASFVQLATLIRVCICCRVSPLQKSEVVTLIKVHLKCTTLAIGDGANDVSMIQSADVGIGISGLEGLQAARAADYTISQFRFLKKLLFVHGAWSYRRLSKMILYSFYKTLTLYLVSFYFTFLNGFSGQIPWDKLSNAAWNMFYTSFPVIALGVFEQDVSAENLMKYPRLYRSGQQNLFFNLKTFFGWFFTSILHSLLIYLLVTQVFFKDVIFTDGSDSGIFTLGTVAYCCVLLTVTGKIAFVSSYWTIWNQVVIWGSVLLYFLVLLLCGQLYISFYADALALYEIFGRLFGSAQFYVTIIFVPLVCLLRDIIWRYIQRTYFFQDYHIAQEIPTTSPPSLYLLREEWGESGTHLLQTKSHERVPLVSQGFSLTPGKSSKAYGSTRDPEQQPFSKDTGFE